MSNLLFSDRVLNMKPSATLGMAQAARELLEDGVDVISLSAGEPDFVTPKSICDMLKLSLDQGLTHYTPVRGTKSFIAAMQEKFLRDQKVRYAADEVMCTVGAKSAILLALLAIVNDGDEVIVFSPYWVSYIEQIRLAGGKAVVIECDQENNFMPSGAQLADAITEKTKAVILNSPNNPSGGVISEPQLKQLADALKDKKIWLISDEIYEKLLFDDQVHHSPASVDDDIRERTIVITGASKGYAMTGFRVGVVAGNKSIISAMAKLQGQQVTCLPEFIQDAAAFAFKENRSLKLQMDEMNQSYQSRRDFGIELFAKILPKVNIYKPQGAFYLWADFSSYMGTEVNKKIIVDDVDLATRMLREAHVGCAPGSAFGVKGYLRLSIASSKSDIKKAAERIAAWLS